MIGQRLNLFIRDAACNRPHDTALAVLIFVLFIFSRSFSSSMSLSSSMVGWAAPVVAANAAASVIGVIYAKKWRISVPPCFSAQNYLVADRV